MMIDHWHNRSPFSFEMVALIVVYKLMRLESNFKENKCFKVVNNAIIKSIDQIYFEVTLNDDVS